MMTYSIDSINEETVRLVCDRDGTEITLPLKRLPDNVREGDILTCEDGRFSKAPEFTIKRRKSSKELTEKILMSEIKRKIYIETLGCKVNFYESAALQKQFGEAGYSVAEKMEDADVVILNSCTVTENSDRKARAFCRKVRQENPDAVLVLEGCFAQAFPDKAAELEVDILKGTSNRNETLAAVEKFLMDRQHTEDVEVLKSVPYEYMEADELLEHTRAFLKIQDGCERYCTYCAIPFARGPVRSLPLERVREQAKRFADNGYTEIVLCGINLSAYGTDLGCDLGDAVIAACEPESVVRVRLGSLECDILSDEMLDKFCSCSKFCPQFHLSLQSGCDRTLKHMNRKYKAEEYKAVCDRIRKKFTDPVFTTDIITGFPGETEEDHRQSVEFAKSIGFLKAHVFPYSRRSGTFAAGMKEQVTRNEKQRRAREMTRELAPISREILESFVGRKARVILETREGDHFTGYTDRYLPAIVTGEDLCEKMVVEGVITGIEGSCAVVRV